MSVLIAVSTFISQPAISHLLVKVRFRSQKTARFLRFNQSKPSLATFAIFVNNFVTFYLLYLLDVIVFCELVIHIFIYMC